MAIYFDSVKIDAPQKKILEFNAELGKLNEKDLTYFELCCKVLSKPEFYHSSDVGPYQIEVIKKLLDFP